MIKLGQFYHYFYFPIIYFFCFFFFKAKLLKKKSLQFLLYIEFVFALKSVLWTWLAISEDSAYNAVATVIWCTIHGLKLAIAIIYIYIANALLLDLSKCSGVLSRSPQIGCWRVFSRPMPLLSLQTSQLPSTSSILTAFRIQFFAHHNFHASIPRTFPVQECHDHISVADVRVFATDTWPNFIFSTRLRGQNVRIRHVSVSTNNF